MKSYEKKNVYQNLLHGIYDYTGHGVQNIIIYNIVSHNSLFLFSYSRYNSFSLEFMNKFLN